uniref:RING-type domain-containing protein n=1 Tax=Grammatophora oceanica TaxID=210454 RepID=A0A7S1VR09_9STRA
MNDREGRYRQALEATWSYCSKSSPPPYSLEALYRMQQILLHGRDEEIAVGSKLSTKLFRKPRIDEPCSIPMIQSMVREHSHGMQKLEDHLHESVCNGKTISKSGGVSEYNSEAPSSSLEDLVLAAATLTAASCFSVWALKPFRKGNFRLVQVVFNWALHRMLGTHQPFRFTLSSGGRRGREEISTAVKQIQCNLSLVAVGAAAPSSESLLSEALGLTSIFLPLVHPILRRFKSAIHKLDGLIRIQQDYERAGGGVARNSSASTIEAPQVAQPKEEDDIDANDKKEEEIDEIDDDILGQTTSIVDNGGLEERVAKDVRQRQVEGDCLICFDEGPNISLLCCGKGVHFHCLNRWLEGANSGGNKSCPQCRTEIPLKGDAPSGTQVDAAWASALTRGISSFDDDVLDLGDGMLMAPDVPSGARRAPERTRASGSRPRRRRQQRRRQGSRTTPSDPTRYDHDVEHQVAARVRRLRYISEESGYSSYSSGSDSESSWTTGDISWLVSSMATLSPNTESAQSSASLSTFFREVLSADSTTSSMMPPESPRSRRSIPEPPLGDSTPPWVRRRTDHEFRVDAPTPETLETTELGGLPTLWEGNHEWFDYSTQSVSSSHSASNRNDGGGGASATTSH